MLGPCFISWPTTWISVPPISSSLPICSVLTRFHCCSRPYATVRSPRTSRSSGMSASRRSRSGCLGDRVSRRTAWKIAREHGWETTFDAEYLAVCKLHADALITIDHALAAKAAYIVPLATSRSAGRELIAVDVRTESLAWGQAPMTPTGPQLSRESAVTEAPLRTPEQRPRTSLHLGQLTRPERASVCSTFSTLGGGTEPAHYSASRIWLAHTERAPSSRAALVLREQFVDPRGVDALCR